MQTQPMPSPAVSDWLPLPEPPARLWQYARKETIQTETGRDRRRDRRYSLITSVRVVPIDGRQRPIGPPFVALSSGMSVSGIRLLHTEAPPSKFLRLEFEGQTAQFVLSVIRTRPIGDCYEIAGRIRKVRQNAAAPVVTAPDDTAPVATAPDDRVLGASALADPAATASPLVGHEAEPPAAPAGEFLQWAAVSAAAQVLTADSSRRSSAD
jgi:hypothetical protein